jgi:molecular chaperone GrpE (heat shock protein)
MHEVLQAGPGKEGEITEVFEEGYELSGRVLRPAKVKVGSGE